MTRPSRDIHITGIGMVTPVGIGRDHSWEGFCAGRSGIAAVCAYDASQDPVRIAAEIPDFDAVFAEKVRLPFRQRYARFTRLALLAGQEALDDAGLDLDKEDVTRIGIVMGVGAGPLHYMGPVEEAMRGGCAGIDKIIDHHFVVKTMFNAPASMLSIRHGLEGPSTTVCAACASGAHAVALAMAWLDGGQVDVVIAGATDSTVTKHTLLAYHRAGALSSANEMGASASRPFDRDRSGFIMGEGAAALVLESGQHARRRGAESYARLLGCGLVSEAYQLAAPRKDGDYMARTMRLALADAGIAADAIAYVNAHAPSTPLGDAAEARAIKAVFRDKVCKIPVTAPKSMMGHPIGASSAIQIALTAMSIRHGIVTPTINLDHQDSEIELDVIPSQALEMPVPYAICNAFGFGGHNACVVLGR
ncbi:MAG: beta-ketoacyl-[acyl-carrier-protein] synthase family protein [Methylococcaceae bacterium]|nr:beta-ketoacyl-[acyl-carrier-protein] synthase family protein [Methylococcaceae bacterium]